MLRIALLGDYHPDVTAHQAIPLALQLAEQALERELDYQWLASDSPSLLPQLAAADAIWCVPASPYRSMAGALSGIRYARERQLPFLGTCGGFQHAIIEYARHALGWQDAEHAETAPDAPRAVISELACALVEVKDRIRLLPGSRIAQAYGSAEIQEAYRCRFGLNPDFAAELTRGPLRASAVDDDGEVRAIELDGHRFFAATLFQPERAALQGVCPPLVKAWLQAC